MIQVYTGNGKGKTTAALGLGLRAVGAGQKVCLVQFLKDGQSSEINCLRKYLPNFKAQSFGQSSFVIKNKINKEDTTLAKQGFNFAQKAIQSKKYDLIILDEINMAVSLGLITVKDLVSLIKAVPQKTELVLTGRHAPKEIIQLADLVTEFKEIKHYFTGGRQARKGVEY